MACWALSSSLSSWAAWVSCMHDEEQFLLFACWLLGMYLPKVSGGCPTFPVQKSRILRIYKMDTWHSLCLLANRSSQKIALLLIHELLLETLQLFGFFFLLFVCSYWQTKGIIHYSKLLKEASNCQVWNYAACSVTSRKRHVKCFKTYKGESSLYVWI